MVSEKGSCSWKTSRWRERCHTDLPCPNRIHLLHPQRFTIRFDQECRRRMKTNKKRRVKCYLDKCREVINKHRSVLISSVEFVNKRIHIIILNKVTASCTQEIDWSLYDRISLFASCNFYELALVLLVILNLLIQRNRVLPAKKKKGTQNQKREYKQRRNVSDEEEQSLTLRRAALSS